MLFYTELDDERAVGFVAVKMHNIYTAEIYVMGVLENYHRQGIGRKLVEQAGKYCRENHMEFLTVKTVDEANPHEGYRKTREFYKSAGFKPLEVFPLLWGKDNPCLFLVKGL
ncbi:MAG: GNAT family N-acetyltransferase [Clostridiales bacterium]|jgi:GNAT superfamily N-acetyltransferase|nr:GNAT family N-acetyltransferase [Clostridiales bacterium]